ncbi:MAG: HU family DNA-binding protein [Clostridia bacterium]|nr:HU family DNA-binding protein [Clostridia bacterium]
MNKVELVKYVSQETGLTQKDVTEVFDTALAAVTTALKRGEEVAIAGLGKFDVRKRAARKSVNPRTKELVSVPASKAPVFKAGKALKDAVNGK